jgi:hypothetical protein
MEELSVQDASDADPLPSVDDLNIELDRARRQGNAAVLFLVIGLGVTISTYAMASVGGGRYYFALGIIGFGIIQAARSNTRRNRAKALLQNASAVVMPRSASESQ